jgi:hypothetical protein
MTFDWLFQSNGKQGEEKEAAETRLFAFYMPFEILIAEIWKIRNACN